MKISLSKYRIYNLQREYTELTDYLFQLQNHINMLNHYNIITVGNKNKYINRIYDIIKKINSQYNDYHEEYIELDSCSSDSADYIDEQASPYLKSIADIYQNEDRLFEAIKEHVSMNKVLEIHAADEVVGLFYDELLHNPLKNVREMIINLCQSAGFPSVKGYLKLLMGKCYHLMYDDQTMNFINLYDKLFVSCQINWKPVSVLINNGQISSSACSDNGKCLDIFWKKTSGEDTFILDKGANLYIKYSNSIINYIVFQGYIINDDLNVICRTSQIGNKFLFNKKRTVEKMIKINKVNRHFIKAYLKHAPLAELIIYSPDEYVKNVYRNYEQYIQLINKTFMELMKEFIKKGNTVFSMYNTIRLLLLGSDENVNIAGLLFGLTKDKKVKGTLVSDIIYDNLHFQSKTKLKKTGPNMKKELKKIQSLTSEDIDYQKKIITTRNMPDTARNLALEKVEEMKLSNNDYFKQLLYVKTLIQFPWVNSEEGDPYYMELSHNEEKRIKVMDGARDRLFNLSYGNKKAKMSVIQQLGKWITNPTSRGNVIAFYGPPGTGKTLLAKNIGTALNIPFIQITLGGQNDGELLHGHGYTYGSAQPGMIIRKMSEIGKSRCIIYFDELDKSCEKHGGGNNEITSILIHLTDPNMNNSFQDRFFQGIDFHLDRVIFIFSYNDPSLVDPTLLSRFNNKIEIKPYTITDKIEIAKQYMIPEVAKTIGFEEDQIVFGDTEIEFIVEEFTMEAGVRGLKHKLESILLHLNIDRIYKEGYFENKEFDAEIVLNKEIIKDILKKPLKSRRKIHALPEVGVINGLYATGSGTGGLIPIQIYPTFSTIDDKFDFQITGNQGQVMKESVICAYTSATNYINKNKEEYGINDLTEYLTDKFCHGFHIHCPSTATPKDGPSAGCAITCAFVSQILGKPIKNDIAMTGEIDLGGQITKIGGLRYKLIGAKKAGAETVFVPLENESDLEDIKKDNPKLIDENFEIVLVKSLDDVIKRVII